MEDDYWYMSYSWLNDSNKLRIEHCVHEGNLMDFVVKYPLYPIINQIQISKEVYEELDGEIG